MSAAASPPAPAAAAAAKTASILLSGAAVSQADMEALFDALAPVAPEDMFGRWAEGYVNVQDEGTQRTNDELRGLRWAGKAFRSRDDVDPMLVYDGEGGGRTPNGHKARVREIRHRGAITATMIYDELPIVDAFKRVSDDLLLGMMDHRDEKYPRNYMFYLARLKE